MSRLFFCFGHLGGCARVYERAACGVWSAWRRRERRLHSWAKHERLSVAMACGRGDAPLLTRTEDCHSQQGGGGARATSRHQKAPPRGTWVKGSHGRSRGCWGTLLGAPTSLGFVSLGEAVLRRLSGVTSQVRGPLGSTGR